MTQTTFSDNVLIDGSQDIEQLRVQGHTTQDDPLQTWENSAGSVLAQITSDGRLQVGDDLGLATADSLLEVHRAEVSTAKPKRGIHSLGQIGGTLAEVVQWMVGEMEVRGSSAINALHTALCIRASNLNTGTPTGNAELRGADIEVINDASAGTAALTKATGLQVGITNATGKTITDAVGLRVKMNNSGTITNPYAIFTEGAGPIHLEDYLEVKRPAAVPGTPATDFIRLYPKSDGKLYAKNWSGVETELGGGGGGGSTPQYAILADRVSQGTNGGGSTANAWTTRNLNTEVDDANNLIPPLSSNQFTPVAGQYRLNVQSSFRQAASGVGNGRLRLRNITQGTTVAVSPNYFMQTDQGVQMFLDNVQFTANGSDAYAIQYYVTVARGTTGLGTNMNVSGEMEEYTRVYLEKIG